MATNVGMEFVLQVIGELYLERRAMETEIARLQSIVTNCAQSDSLNAGSGHTPSGSRTPDDAVPVPPECP